MNINIIREKAVPGARFVGSTKPAGMRPKIVIREIVSMEQDVSIEARMCHQYRIHYLEDRVGGFQSEGKMTLKGFSTWADRLL
jgi:hypothetical protein